MKTEEIKRIYFKHRLGIKHQWDSEKINNKPMPRWFVDAMEECANQFKGISCKCTPDKMTGTTTIACCNQCGKSTESFWTTNK